MSYFLYNLIEYNQFTTMTPTYDLHSAKLVIVINLKENILVGDRIRDENSNSYILKNVPNMPNQLKFVFQKLSKMNQNFEGGIEAMLGIDNDVRNSEIGPKEYDVFRPVDEYETADQKWLGVDEETIHGQL